MRNGIFFSMNPWGLRPQRRFLKDSLARLSTEDQSLFQKFGQGPLVAVPFACIHHAIHQQIAKNPQTKAAVHGDSYLSYAELDHLSTLLAAQLIGLGVNRGDRVGLFMERSLPMIVGILAVLKTGACYVPQDARMTPRCQLQHVVTSASVEVVLTLSRFVDMVAGISELKVLAIDDFVTNIQTSCPSIPNEIDRELCRRRNLSSADDICFILFTSGTTGKPNGVQVTHRNLCNILLTEPGNLGMRPGLKVSQILNIAFDMAAWEILGALAHGATLLIRGRNIQETVEQADVVIATPSILGKIDVTRCHQVKTVAVAGEPCPLPLAEAWSAFANFYNSCGPTEVTIVNTMQLFSTCPERLTIGKPTPNNTVYILNEHLQPCAIGEIGEMWAGGDCVSLGYINNPGLNAERYRSDPFLGGDRKMFRTRDLGRWTTTGELEHLGRTDDQVKIRGFRVELDSVSAALEKVPACVQAVTLKLDSRNLVAFVRPATVDTEMARNIVANLLPYYCTPSLILGLPDFPSTERGKIDKRALTILAVQALEGQALGPGVSAQAAT